VINYVIRYLYRDSPRVDVPSSTPVTIEAKLSSSKIISAACLLTSEPAIPIATPKTQTQTDIQTDTQTDTQTYIQRHTDQTATTHKTECGVAAHSIEHLFNCQSHPMQLTV